MNDHDAPADQASQMISSARATEHAIQHVCRTTVTRPSMTPAEVDIVLAHLADAAAALPQTARQLGDILAQAEEDHVLEMDTSPRPRTQTSQLRVHGATSTTSANRPSASTDCSTPLTTRPPTSP
jgi:hypothetical protein